MSALPVRKSLKSVPSVFLVLKRKPGEIITLKQIRAVEEELEEEELIQSQKLSIAGIVG